MVRKRALDRLPDILDTAENVFMQKGYRRAQMADVTAALGLSPGAVYRYVESKEALFDLVIRRAADRDLPLGGLTLPVPTPPAGAMLAYLRELLAGAADAPALGRALATERPDDVAAELESVILDVFRPIARHHRGLKIVERSSHEWPELAQLWWTEVREAVIANLTVYISRRIEQGLFRRYPDPVAATRLVTEVTAYFAMHRHFDPEPTDMTEEIAERTATIALLGALVAPSQTEVQS